MSGGTVFTPTPVPRGEGVALVRRGLAWMEAVEGLESVMCVSISAVF